MKPLILTILLICSCYCWAGAYPKTVLVNKTNYHFVNKKLLVLPLFGIKMYEVGLYQTKDKKERFLRLHYVRDIDRKYSLMGWRKGLRQNLDNKFRELNGEIQWIYDHTRDFKQGDIVDLGRFKNEGLITLNNKIIAKTTNPKIIPLLTMPWIGPDPVDPDLKKKLLNN